MRRICIVALCLVVAGLLCLAQEPRAQFMLGAGDGGRKLAGGGGTSYVTGDRTASITVSDSTSPGHILDAGTMQNLVDGGFGNNSTDSTFFGGVDVTDRFVLFDFGTGKVVDEAKWYQDVGSSHGTFKWQGSNDNSSYTDIGSSFTLGGSTLQTQTSLNGNSTSYRYYRLIGVSGTASSAPWLQEIEFKQN